MTTPDRAAPPPYYRDDLVTIYHGDCRELIGTVPTAAAVVTDPPYGMGWNVDTTRFGGGSPESQKRRGGTGDRQPVIGDTEPFDPAPWLAFPEVILWGLNHYPDRLPPGSVLVFVKRNDEGYGTFLSDAEIAWKKGGRGVYCFRDLSMNASARTRFHPTEKPLGLMRWCLGFVSPDRIVADPFMGSGSTLVAAKSLGRRSIGIDLDERYCEIAATRCSQEVLGLLA